ncbi:MAG TPA: hypothetical protein VER96_19335, partial [Polyangiaceae bacterium]|nr:hypothetical protein [Polyangiaceae bacterium]
MRLRFVLSAAAAPWFLVGFSPLLSGCDLNSTSSSGGPAGATSVGGTHSTGGSGTTGGTNAGGMSSSAGGAANGGTSPGSGGTSAGGTTPGSGGTPTITGGSSSGGAAATCAGALICDDFESYTGTPKAPWTVSTNNGSVAIDTTKFRSGKQSVKFSTTGANTYQRAFIGLEGAPISGCATPDKCIANNAFYGRMMIYATSAANDGVHWTMIQGEGPVAAQGLTNAQVRYGGQQMKSLMANYDSTGKKSDCWQHSATKMPEGQWACMQWYFDGKT